MSLYTDHVSLFDESARRVMQDLPQTPQPRKAELRGRDPTQIGAVFGKRGDSRYQSTEQERFPHIAVKKHVDRVLGPTMRKPFDVLVEGLLLKNSRGDKTAIELFIVGVRSWEAWLRLQLDDVSHLQD